MDLLCPLLQAYFFVCVVRVIFSWLPDLSYGNAWANAIQTATYALTEPVFGTVRRAMPTIGDLPIDLSPIVVFLGLSLIIGLVC